MILVFFFMSLLLSCLPLHTATYNHASMPTCPKNFSCTYVLVFKYPFYKSSDTGCGSIKVNCTSEGGKFQLGERSYEAMSNLGPGSSFWVRDTTLENLVKTNSCKALVYNFTISPSPRLFSISIKPFITLFKCTNNPSDAAEMDAYFDPHKYHSHKGCKDYNFYYKHPINDTSIPSDLPRICQPIYLPEGQKRFNHKAPDETNIFSLISPYFFISFRLSPFCAGCHKKEGRCHIDHKGELRCLDAKKGKHEKLILISVLAGSAAFILVLSFVIFIIWRRYKSNPFSYFSSKQKCQDHEDGSPCFGVPVFSYTELQDATRDFDPSRELGDGGFGAVYHGKLQDGREVAVKRLYEHNYRRVQHFMNEVQILTRLRHPNLVLLYGCTSRQSRELLLVYEYIPNGTVADHLHGERANPRLLTWPIRMNIAIETASALVYLHASEIIHRDVKTNNILLDHNFCVKVADFGLSRLLPNDVTHVSTAPQGTPGYVDPQYHQCYKLTDKSDVYSFGVVLIELISSMVAVDLSRPPEEVSLASLALNRIQRCAFDELIDPVLGSDSNAEIMRMITSVAELAFRCLQYDSEMRPTMNEVLGVLEDIQGEGRTEAHNSSRDLSNASSETKDTVVLFKDLLPSPVSVTGEWQSNSSSSTTVSISADRLPMKISIST